MNDDRNRLVLLDLLRFFAATSVLIFHYKSIYLDTLAPDNESGATIYAVTKFGYLGVDLFFLISGFVIFSSALHRTPLQFLISRAIRIYPTFWLCATITTLVILLVPNPYASVTIIQYLVNLTLLHEYLGIAAIDGLYWTLVIELKFYGCIFLLTLMGWIKSYRIWLPIWLIMTIAFIFSGQPFFLGWFISPEYSPYFISGIIFYLAQREGYDKLYVLMLLVSTALALRHSFLVADTFTHEITFSDRVIVNIIVSGFFILFFLISKNKINLKTRTVYLILGGMTYSIYLLHNVCGKLVFYYFKGSLDSLLLLALTTMSVLFLSYIVFSKFEKRISNPLKRFLLVKLSPNKGNSVS